MAKNRMTVSFLALPENVSFARVVVASFISQLDPTMEEVTDVQTVISEAVTNAIVHGYEGNQEGVVAITVELTGRTAKITVEDHGKGIANLEQAKEPLFTSKPEQEHTGMGFTIMENFVNEMKVETEVGKGTIVHLVKHFQMDEALYN